MPPIRTERPLDGPQIESLLDRAFGVDRHARPSYRLREGLRPVPSLCLVAEDGGLILGTIRHWPVRIGATHPALLLGPIAVDPAHERCGIGGYLVRRALDKAATEGHSAVVAVGAATYLGRFGFTNAARFGITLPDVARVFILPPSLEALEQRLNRRAQDSPAVVAQRMSRAGEEMRHYDEYDYVVVNTTLERAVEEVRSILWAERLRRDRLRGLGDFVLGLTAGTKPPRD